MGDKSSIEWTDATWNPIRGCSRVSEGCRNCYAERTAIRQASPRPSGNGLTTIAGPYTGLVRSTPQGPRWTGEVRFAEDVLDAPLRWKRPRRIFVNSMSDLFHEKVEDEWIDRIFRTMVVAQQHTYQILTKRPERMRDYLTARKPAVGAWPPAWIHLGVSVENQAAAAERIPLLLQTPAAVRFLSVEPLLGPVDLSRWLTVWEGSDPSDPCTGARVKLLDWIIVGGESEPGARPCDLAWIRSVVTQAKAAGVPVFVKQLGARPLVADSDFGQLGEDAREALDGSNEVRLRDRKGGDWTEWPEDLRVREFFR